jgi:hypothetical protein
VPSVFTNTLAGFTESSLANAIHFRVCCVE